METKKPTTSSAKPPLKPLNDTINQLVDYLGAMSDHDVAGTGLLNWFSVHRGKSVFDENFLIDRSAYPEKLSSLLTSDAGRAHDAMIMAVANDLIAQVETAAGFRRLKIGHHFAKSRHNIELLSNGAQKPRNSESILKEYTSVFLENASKYISK